MRLLWSGLLALVLSWSRKGRRGRAHEQGKQGSTARSFGSSTPRLNYVGSLFDGGAAGDGGLGALFDLAAGEEDAPAAGEADEADVGAEADDTPFVAAAGVGLAEAEDVVEAEVLHGHGGFIIRRGLVKEARMWRGTWCVIRGA